MCPNRRLPSDTKVIFYSGYKNSETPRSVIIQGKKMPILEILSRERQDHPLTNTIHEVFVCRTQDHILKITRYPNGRAEVFVKEESPRKI